MHSQLTGVVMTGEAAAAAAAVGSLRCSAVPWTQATTVAADVGPAAASTFASALLHGLVTRMCVCVCVCACRGCAQRCVPL